MRSILKLGGINFPFQQLVQQSSFFGRELRSLLFEELFGYLHPHFFYLFADIQINNNGQLEWLGKCCASSNEVHP